MVLLRTLAIAARKVDVYISRACSDPDYEYDLPELGGQHPAVYVQAHTERRVASNSPKHVDLHDRGIIRFTWKNAEDTITHRAEKDFFSGRLMRLNRPVLRPE